MKKVLLLLLIFILAVGAYVLFFQAPSTGSIDLLVFSKTGGFRHQSIEAGQEALRRLGEEHSFGLKFTEESSDFSQEILKKFDAVVFLNTTGDVLNEVEQLELNRFIQAGGGFVGIHAAADTEYDWPWYGQLVGGYFSSHPNNPNVREGLILVSDASHASTRMLPQQWRRTDEWYDYRSYDPGLNVLLMVEEGSYKRAEENPASDPRPIAWYHDFEGGRSFYTGLGHTVESYSEELFLQHLLGGILYAAGDGRGVNFARASVAPEENRFVQTVLVSNLNEPMELDLLPDGRILWVERDGALKIHDEQFGVTETIVQMEVFSEQEEGLLGIAVDPNFPDNQWIYLSYSAPDAPEIRLSRFQLDDKNLVRESEKVLLTVPVQRDECCHVAGSLEFAPDGNLFFSVGDNTNPHESGGFAPIDEREGRAGFDAQKSSSNTHDLRGKILRIRPESDGSYSIPAGNLFPPDGSQGRPEIYVMGCRNPFRISIDSRSGVLYWGEIGPDAGEDQEGRGPRGYDEINRASEAGNYGWPYFIADNKAYQAFDFSSDRSGALFDPGTPMNDSPNNTGKTELPPARPALIWYPYSPSPEFGLLGKGGRNAMAGPVFHFADYADSETRFPDYYDGKLFIYDWMRGWMMAVTLDPAGVIQRIEPFLPSFKLDHPMDMLFAPDGTLYLLEYGPIWFAGSPEARLSHITFNRGNRAPVARFEAQPALGAAPLTVRLESRSFDHDADPLKNSWDFGNGQSSIEATAEVTYQRPGYYPVKLTVTDPEGLRASYQLELQVGNDVPEVRVELEGNRSFFWPDEPFRYRVEVNDTEDGSLESGVDPKRVTVSIDHLSGGGALDFSKLGHQAALEESRSLIGKLLAAQSDCENCHQKETPSVGPSYLRIADRYKTQDGAAETLAGKIIEGGSGNWGNVPMAPHPQVPREEALQMASYILSLAGEQTVTRSAPLEGSFQPPSGATGRYLISATYTDQGGREIGPLTGRDIVTLRPALIPAIDYDTATKGGRFTVPPDAPGAGRQIVLGEHGAEITYAALDLTGISAITGNFVLAPGYSRGGTVELHLDQADGPLLGTFELAQGLTSFGNRELTMELEPVEGTHDLVFVYRTEGGSGLCCIVISFQMHRRDD